MLGERQVALLWLASRRRLRLAQRADLKHRHVIPGSRLLRRKARKLAAFAEYDRLAREERDHLADQQMGM